VTPQQFSTRPIAVPPFEVEGQETYQTDVLSEVVANDLYLSGFFHLPRNPEFVREVHELDRRTGQIHFADWFRLGMAYVIKGKYRIEGERLEVEVRAYDATAGTYIFGKLYPRERYQKNNPREVAHLISDHIVERITGFPGVASTRLLIVREVSWSGGSAVKEVFAMDADGQNMKQLTQDGTLVATPAWGAHGTEFYYMTYKDFNTDLAGMFLDGSYGWFISRQPGLNMSPHWSEAKKRIVLTLSKDGNPEIYTMTREGKDLRRVTYNRAIDGSPVWSPTGDLIAFTSDRNGSRHLYLTDEEGVTVRRLTQQGGYNDGASWSPSGDRIAYASQDSRGVFQIWTINSDGTDPRQLTHGSANCEDPVWAPNGWLLAYTSEETGKKQVFTMFIDGRRIARLTSGNESFSAAWSPLSPR